MPNKTIVEKKKKKKKKGDGRYKVVRFLAAISSSAIKPVFPLISSFESLEQKVKIPCDSRVTFHYINTNEIPSDLSRENNLYIRK